ncbi:MAG: hypothetical protein CEE38_06855 [Planctomycetes bacterium B3_Pla]|nr:MAG: hypothetical protein CEE38_06855 [Planctomycetes bacterium B3_Pla]
MNHEEYIKRRAELVAIRDDSFEAFDKSILSLSTGCLVLSITFLDKIGEPFNKVTFFLIFASWAAFLIVLMSNLASYLFAKSNMDRKIDELDNQYRKELKTKKADTTPEKVYWQNKVTRFCNKFAFIVFCIGVFTILTYVSLIQINNYSIMKENHEVSRVMSENKNTPLNEGKTEAPKAVPTTVDPGKINTHGKTESPQPVIKPSKPGEKK